MISQDICYKMVFCFSNRRVGEIILFITLQKISGNHTSCNQECYFEKFGKSKPNKKMILVKTNNTSEYLKLEVFGQTDNFTILIWLKWTRVQQSILREPDTG